MSVSSTLRVGAKGEEVKVLQRLLNRALAPPPGLAVDGDFGKSTRLAVESFQRQSGLIDDGVVGPRT